MKHLYPKNNVILYGLYFSLTVFLLTVILCFVMNRSTLLCTDNTAPLSSQETDYTEMSSEASAPNETLETIKQEYAGTCSKTPLSHTGPSEFEIPLKINPSDLNWTCASEQVDGAYGVNQRYLVWIPDISGPKDVVIMMHISKNPLENTGYPSDWIDHTYYFDGVNNTPWKIGDALAGIAEKRPFILVAPNYLSWCDTKIPHDPANQDFLLPDCHIKFLKDICAKYDTYADPTVESIIANRDHFILGGASIGGNWTSFGIIKGLSKYYSNFIIGSDSTKHQIPLKNLSEALHTINEPTLIWCVNGTKEGSHTLETWDYLKKEPYDSVTVKHLMVTDGQHLYATWVTGLDAILTFNYQ